jgi:BirA family transcriptional regulator, biotin operon repressor / biotin---[acetyl-CoA-carboxylase] ligase
MIPVEFETHLRDARFSGPAAGFDVRWLASTPSTMDVASKLASEGAAAGVVVVADEQTAGRGRRGNNWSSPPGAGLYLSYIARPKMDGLPLLTLAAGVAVRDGVVASTGLWPNLKWPNDLIVGRRKLAGILAEGIAIGPPDQAVIIGIGINLQPASYPPDVSARATSLEGELGRSIDRGLVLVEVLAALRDRLAELEQKPGDILQMWRASAPSAIGTRVEWDGRTGVTAGIDDTGALLVKTTERIERVIAGEVNWHLST